MTQVGAFISRVGLDAQGIVNAGTEFWNLAAPALYEHAIRGGEAQMSAGGALVAHTGVHTGRSASDKFIVRDATTEDNVDWGAVNRAITPEQFDEYKLEVDLEVR